MPFKITILVILHTLGKGSCLSFCDGDYCYNSSLTLNPYSLTQAQNHCKSISETFSLLQTQRNSSVENLIAAQPEVIAGRNIILNIDRKITADFITFDGAVFKRKLFNYHL